MDTRVEKVALKNLDTRHSCLRLVRPELIGALRCSIERHGVLTPLVVNVIGAKLVLLDGFKRFQVLREQGESSVLARHVELTDVQAKAAIVTFNVPHRGMCDLEEAWVVASLVRGNKLRQIEVAALLGKHKSWVTRRLQLIERLDEQVVDDLRLGLLSVTMARELARLPRGNQAALAKVICGEGLTSRQATELVSRWLEATDSDGRKALLDEPLRYLSSMQKEAELIKRDPRLSTGADKIRQCLLRFEHAADRLEHCGRWQHNAGLRPTDLEVLGQYAQSSFEAVMRAVRLVCSICDLEQPHV